MKKIYTLIIVVLIATFLVACSSSTADVPSLGSLDAPDSVESELTEEESVMAFTECMRDLGINFMDPEVDSKGNVQKPRIEEGSEFNKDDVENFYDVCGFYLEEMSFGQEKVDSSERIDQFLKLSICLRDAGHDVDDPDADNLNEWLLDFKESFDFSDDKANEDYKTCSEVAGISGFGEGVQGKAGGAGSPGGAGKP